MMRLKIKHGGVMTENDVKCWIDDKTVVIVVPSYRCVSRNPVQAPFAVFYFLGR